MLLTAWTISQSNCIVVTISGPMMQHRPTGRHDLLPLSSNSPDLPDVPDPELDRGWHTFHHTFLMLVKSPSLEWAKQMRHHVACDNALLAQLAHSLTHSLIPSLARPLARTPVLSNLIMLPTWVHDH